MTKSKSNNLVGRTVRIDFGPRWKAARPEHQYMLKADYVKRSDYDQPGEIVAYNPGDEFGQEYEVLFTEGHEKGCIARYNYMDFTVTSEAVDLSAKTNELLAKILVKLETMAEK